MQNGNDWYEHSTVRPGKLSRWKIVRVDRHSESIVAYSDDRMGAVADAITAEMSLSKLERLNVIYSVRPYGRAPKWLFGMEN